AAAGRSPRLTAATDATSHYLRIRTPDDGTCPELRHSATAVVRPTARHRSRLPDRAGDASPAPSASGTAPTQSPALPSTGTAAGTLTGPRRAPEPADTSPATAAPVVPTS